MPRSCGAPLAACLVVLALLPVPGFPWHLPPRLPSLFSLPKTVEGKAAPAAHFATKVAKEVIASATAAAIIAAAHPALPGHQAVAVDFGGLPSSPAKPRGLRGSSGALAAPSESGLGLFVDKNGPSLLRLAVMDTDTNAREVQTDLELVALRLDQVGFSGKTPVWNSASSDVARAEQVLAKSKESFVSEVLAEDKTAATDYIDRIAKELPLLKDATRAQNYDETIKVQRKAADDMASLRELIAKRSLKEKPFYDIPSEYKSLPRLEGRATVDVTIKSTDGKKKTMTIVADGFHAPLAAGRFVYLAKAGAYNNVPLAYSEELIVQTGKPAAKKRLDLPLELFYRGDTAPSYEYTQDEDGRGSDTQVLPFQAYGAVGMAHPDEENGGGEGDFFFVKYDQGLMPPGRNTLDGAYTCFGYTIDGGDSLATVRKGDVVVSAEVRRGIENLVMPGA